MSWEEQIKLIDSGVTDVVFAIGFNRGTVSDPIDPHLHIPPSHSSSIDSNNTTAHTSVPDRHASLDGYCTKTGQIFGTRSNIFGCGIAFPHDFTDDEGHTEPWVGFLRSIEQVDFMVHASCASPLV
jgi:hypothetical protein